MRPCVIGFPCSIGDEVTVFGDPGWVVVGMCASDRGKMAIVEKGIGSKVVAIENLEEEETMTKEQLAAKLDGREYLQEMTAAERDEAKASGLVAVYGYSDDCMEFEGAINDEIDCYEGGIAYLDKNGLFVHECDCGDCPYAEREREKCKTIKAVWGQGETPWTYETDIPHATFCINENGEPWCTGIVFEMEALK